MPKAQGGYTSNGTGGGNTYGEDGAKGAREIGLYKLLKGDKLYIYQGTKGESSGYIRTRTGQANPSISSGGGGSGASSEVRLNKDDESGLILFANGGNGGHGVSVNRGVYSPIGTAHYWTEGGDSGKSTSIGTGENGGTQERVVIRSEKTQYAEGGKSIKNTVNKGKNIISNNNYNDGSGEITVQLIDFNLD